jgi:hypothetical protein
VLRFERDGADLLGTTDKAGEVLISYERLFNDKASSPLLF